MTEPTPDRPSSSFPACKHRRVRHSIRHRLGLRWLAEEPFRVFFISGAVWSAIGVLLWPLFYVGLLSFHPLIVHSRLMIAGFGGAFVVGFLGTAGPRLAGAPQLTQAEFILLLLLHQSGAFLHLSGRIAGGDLCFALLLAFLATSLLLRAFRHRRETPPPRLLLAWIGLVCGFIGTLLHLTGGLSDPRWYRLANLLLYQGFLLAPVLGIGSFLFPRILGGVPEELDSPQSKRCAFRRAAVAGGLLVTSFALEASGWVKSGYGVRVLTAAIYLYLEVNWQARRSGPLTSGLFWSLGLGGLGLALAPFHYHQHIAIEHLLYVGGFGMLMLIVGSRVLFGHAGEGDEFFAKGRWGRILLCLGILAAATRATPAMAPSTTVSHHIYAATTWALLVVLWLAWHRSRFFKRDPEVA